MLRFIADTFNDHGGRGTRYGANPVPENYLVHYYAGGQDTANHGQKIRLQVAEIRSELYVLPLTALKPEIDN